MASYRCLRCQGAKAVKWFTETKARASLHSHGAPSPWWHPGVCFLHPLRHLGLYHSEVRCHTLPHRLGAPETGQPYLCRSPLLIGLVWKKIEEKRIPAPISQQSIINCLHRKWGRVGAGLGLYIAPTLLVGPERKD